MRDREREQQRHRQREKQASCREPDAGPNPGSPGSGPGLKGALNHWLSPPGCPVYRDLCCFPTLGSPSECLQHSMASLWFQTNQAVRNMGFPPLNIWTCILSAHPMSSTLCPTLDSRDNLYLDLLWRESSLWKSSVKVFCHFFFQISKPFKAIKLVRCK